MAKGFPQTQPGPRRGHPSAPQPHRPTEFPMLHLRGALEGSAGQGAQAAEPLGTAASQERAPPLARQGRARWVAGSLPPWLRHSPPHPPFVPVSPPTAIWPLPHPSYPHLSKPSRLGPALEPPPRPHPTSLPKGVQLPFTCWSILFPLTRSLWGFPVCPHMP